MKQHPNQGISKLSFCSLQIATGRVGNFQVLRTAMMALSAPAMPTTGTTDFTFPLVVIHSL